MPINREGVHINTEVSQCRMAELANDELLSFIYEAGLAAGRFARTRLSLGHVAYSDYQHYYLTLLPVCQ